MQKSPHSRVAGERLDELSRQRLIDLFSPAADESDEAPAIDRRIEQLSRQFLSETRTGSEIDFTALASCFRTSLIPSASMEIEDYLDYLSEQVVAHSTRTSSPRFIGHMTSALPAFLRPLSKLMVALNQNVVKVETARALTSLERQVLAMIHRLIYGCADEFYDRHVQDRDSTLGMIVSGGTQANLTALWCARNAALGGEDGFAGIDQAGGAAARDHYDYPSAVILGSCYMHYSIQKAADILGIGSQNVLPVAVDSNHRIDLGELRRTIAECRAHKRRILALIGIAGTTDSGAIDPLVEMAEIAREAGIHFHVDAAWGGALLFSPDHRARLNGIELADSVTIDGHKQMYLPMGIGLLALRNPHQARAIEKQARYIVRATSADLGKRSLEGSRPGMALLLHAALTIIGHHGYAFLINEGMRKARYMADLIRRHPAFELLTEPECNLLLYRYLPEPYRAAAARAGLSEADNLAINRHNEDLQKAQRERGHSFVSRTTIFTARYGRDVPIVALRVVLANPLTQESDMEEVLQDQLQIAVACVSAVNR